MNRNLLLKLSVAMALFCSVLVADAQWSVGIKGGWDYTTITRSNAGRIDESYSGFSGFDAGIQARYGFTDWFALRADLSFMRRSHRMDRNLNYLDPVFTNHHNYYLMLPVMADFSFGGENLRGHAFAGGYMGYWLRERVVGKTYWMTDYYVFFDDFNEVREFTNEDARFCAGLVGGLGLSYDLDEHWGINFDALYYYDLTSHHRSSQHLRDPRYLNTLTLTFRATYKF